MDLIDNMSGAWAQKHSRIQKQLDQAKKYPLFFKASHVEQLEKDLAEAAEHYRFWAVQV